MLLWKWSLIYIIWRSCTGRCCIWPVFISFVIGALKPSNSISHSEHPSGASAGWQEPHQSWSRMPKDGWNAAHGCWGRPRLSGGRRKDNCSALEYEEKCFWPSSVSTIRHAGIFSALSPSPNPPHHQQHDLTTTPYSSGQQQRYC